MIQETFRRVQSVVSAEHVFVVTGKDYRDKITEQLPELSINNILIEPVGRDTAPSIGLATAYIQERCPKSTMIVLPSDHTVRDEVEFRRTIERAVREAQRSKEIVTVGIVPNRPETGYGYIRVRSEETPDPETCARKVDRFVEKPNIESAEEYVASGEYLWNSGMFIWNTDVIASRIAGLMPDLTRAMGHIQSTIGTPLEDKTIAYEFPRVPSISIDYGIMERSTGIRVIPGDFGWDDVGSWTALERLAQSDDKGNVVSGNVVPLNTQRCIIEANTSKLVATMGVEDLIVIDTEDVTLICSKDSSQDIKRLLASLRGRNLEVYL